MVDDPYKVLGLSKDASKEEIKKAYRKKAKECHPDLHPNDPSASEQMNRVNEAYDMLMNPEKYQKRTAGQTYAGYGQRGDSTQNHTDGSYGQGNPYGWYGYGNGESWQNFEDLFGYRRRNSEILRPERKPEDSETIKQVVDLINIGKYSYADQTLNTLTSQYRDGRWYYLSALANYGMGNTMAALERIQKAKQFEPSNPVYEQVLQSMYDTGRTYSSNGQEYQGMVMDMNRLCLSLWLTQLFCTFFRWC